MAVVMKTPSPSVPAKETPTPTPSAKECAVMMPRISNALVALAPWSSATSTSPERDSSRLARTIAARPVNTPASVMMTSMATPSAIRLWLAASMSPAAAAFAQPPVLSLSFFTKRNGSAPTPVMIAVTKAAAITINSDMSIRNSGEYGQWRDDGYLRDSRRRDRSHGSAVPACKAHTLVRSRTQTLPGRRSAIHGAAEDDHRQDSDGDD